MNHDKNQDSTPPTARRSASREAPAARSETGDAAPAGESIREIGGRNGPDPVRYGDWEKNGRCIDF